MFLLQLVKYFWKRNKTHIYLFGFLNFDYSGHQGVHVGALWVNHQGCMVGLSFDIESVPVSVSSINWSFVSTELPK